MPGHGDPQRLRVAAHELGHYFAYLAADLRIKHIKVWGRGYGAAGNVETYKRASRDTEDFCGYLAGLLAGREADRLWCEQTGLPYRDNTTQTDLKIYKRFKRGSSAAKVPDQVLVGRARNIVVTNWDQIVALTPRLARHGRL